MAVVIPDITPEDLLGSFRGSIAEARPAYPETIQLRLIDSQGGEWWFVTWNADYSPTDPAELAGKEVVDAHLDRESGLLTIVFADDSRFLVTPRPQEMEGPDDPEYWQLFTPGELILNWGPCRRLWLKRR
jgi:hypothetical protein